MIACVSSGYGATKEIFRPLVGSLYPTSGMIEPRSVGKCLVVEGKWFPSAAEGALRLTQVVSEGSGRLRCDLQGRRF